MDMDKLMAKAKSLGEAVIASGAPALLMAQRTEKLRTGTITVPTAEIQARVASNLLLSTSNLQLTFVDDGAQFVVRSDEIRARFEVQDVRFHASGQLGMLAMNVVNTHVQAIGKAPMRWLIALWIGLLRLLGRDPVLGELSEMITPLPGVTMDGAHIRLDLNVLPGVAASLRAAPALAALGPLVVVKNVAFGPAGVAVQVGASVVGQSVVDGARLLVSALTRPQPPTE